MTEELVDQTYAILARTEIEKLFEDARETVGHENSAYVEWRDNDAHFPEHRTSFVAIVNGFLKREGDPVGAWPTMRQAALDSAITVAFMFPCKGQRLLWRRLPVVEYEAPLSRQRAREFGCDPHNGRFLLYMRLAVVPIYVNEFIERPRP